MEWQLISDGLLTSMAIIGCILIAFFSTIILYFIGHELYYTWKEYKQRRRAHPWRA